MVKVCFVNLALLLVLGNLILWPKEPVEIEEDINVAYQSICQIKSADETRASGILLESGYILTAAHVVDKDQNGIVEEHERTVELNFPEIGFSTLAKTVHYGDMNEEMDVAILKPENLIPLPGVKMMKTRDYKKLKIGAKLYIVGMQSGLERANVTDGRLITKEADKIKHRTSANSYKGNSGGGVFVGDKLIGISSQIGLGQLMMSIPVFRADNRRMMMVKVFDIDVPYVFPMSTQSFHVSIPSVRELILSGKYEGDPLAETPAKCPYHKYIDAMIFNASMVFMIILSALMLKELKL